MGISAPFFTYNAEGKATGSETREVKVLDFKSAVRWILILIINDIYDSIQKYPFNI